MIRRLPAACPRFIQFIQFIHRSSPSHPECISAPHLDRGRPSRPGPCHVWGGGGGCGPLSEACLRVSTGGAPGHEPRDAGGRREGGGRREEARPLNVQQWERTRSDPYRTIERRNAGKENLSDPESLSDFERKGKTERKDGRKHRGRRRAHHTSPHPPPSHASV
ncbi:hypothetical protein B0H15DRAFT_337719 [Mycena belliarum]|uniref:Uncharacterized protein n=1 Tax=Mycena belliarum TaxID=1033014 RepID=A0AAD6UGN6_9AGAR|nr:hypothetical protein B0H15DRAFT_337719 [Mycena belliae]